MPTLTLESPVRIRAADAELEGDLALPDRAQGLVIFAHGSGSSRFSARNRLVAARLQEAGVGTLLLDLLTREEDFIDELTDEFRFNVPLLARRVQAAADFARSRRELRDLKLGFFGASTGAAAALIAAAERPDRVDAVVCRSGRPDLAGESLAHVLAPTLFIVGGEDHPQVLQWNRDAMAQLHGLRELAVVPGAGHLFEERGAMERAAELARDWFSCYLSRGTPRGP